MGIANPRPALRHGQRKMIEERLRVHSILMQKFQLEGLDRNAASVKAFQAIRGKPARDLGEVLRKHGL